jgi:hypothetical protein
MRSYIRHPSDIPIEYQRDETGQGASHERLNNISQGGLSFSSSSSLPAGAVVTIRISLIEPCFEARAQVAWCHPDKDGYVVGVTFMDSEDLYRVRMVEQICHIEHYKSEVFQKEGRRLSGEQAAREWIRKFARNFPQLEDENAG